MFSDAQKDILVKFGAHLQSIRKKQNLSLRKLALRCDVEYADISRYEKGELNLTFLTISELAKGLGISLKELMDF